MGLWRVEREFIFVGKKKMGFLCLDWEKTKSVVIRRQEDDLEFQQPKKRRRRPQKGKSTGGIVIPKPKVHYIPKAIENHGDPKGKAQMNTPENTYSSNSSQPLKMPTPKVTVTAPSTSHLDHDNATKLSVQGDTDEAESQSTDPGKYNGNTVVDTQGAETDQIDINVLPVDEEKRKEDLEVQEEVEATMAMGDAVCVDFAGWEAQIESIIRSERVKKTQHHE